MAMNDAPDIQEPELSGAKLRCWKRAGKGWIEMTCEEVRAMDEAAKRAEEREAERDAERRRQREEAEKLNDGQS